MIMRLHPLCLSASALSSVLCVLYWLRCAVASLGAETAIEQLVVRVHRGKKLLKAIAACRMPL
jgi:hypothetical protein